MSRAARKNLFEDNGYGTLNGGTVSRLLRMAEFETAIRVWRDSGELTAHQREHWNSPTSICNRCPAVRKAIAAAKTSTPRKVRNVNRSAAVEKAFDVIGDYLVNLEDDDQRASLAERLAALAPDQKPRGKASPKPITIKEHQDALIELLQDEPPLALQDAVNGFNRRLKKTWGERRKKKIPTREMTAAEDKATKETIKTQQAIAEVVAPLNKISRTPPRRRRSPGPSTIRTGMAARASPRGRARPL